MVLLGEYHQLRGNAHHLRGVERGHTLLVGDAVVHHSVDAEYGGAPLRDHGRGRVLVVVPCLGGAGIRRSGLLHAAEGHSVAGRAGLPGSVGVLGQAAVVPVGEPHLLGGEPELLLVEDARMGYEAVVEPVVQALEHVDRISSVRGAHRRELAHIGPALDVPACRQVVLHVEPAVVAGDLLLPLLSEGGGAAAVGEYHYVSLLRHKAVAPPVAPVLGVRALGAAEKYLHRRVYLAFVELRRVDHPTLHLLAVYGGELYALHAYVVELREYVSVLIAEPAEGRAPCRDVYRDQFERELEAVVGAQQPDSVRTLAYCERREEVTGPRGVGYAAYVAVEVGAEQCLHAFAHEGVEEELVAVPHYARDIVVEVSREAAHAADLHLVAEGSLADLELLAVGLVAVPCHRNPCETAAVGVPYGVGVISASVRHLHGLPAARVVYIDVCVGAERVFLAGLLAAGVGDVPAVGSPVELLYAAERLSGELVEIVCAEYVGGIALAYQSLPERSHIASRDARHPVVPVAVHEVLGSIGRGLVEGGVAVRGSLHRRVPYGAGVYQRRFVGGELELSYSGLYFAELLLLAETSVPVRRRPYLAVLDEVYLLPVVRPACVAYAFGVARQLGLAAAVGVADEEVAAAGVLLDRGIGHPVEDLGTVGGELGVGEPAHSEQRLGSHHPVFDYDVRGADVAAFVRFRTAHKHCCGKYA